MAKTWYPMIDFLNCVGCGTCVKNCPNGVYGVIKGETGPSPLVINPDACSDHCHHCGSVCPKGAITYFGEDTDWRPPNGK